jgi:hypothetical protein
VPSRQLVKHKHAVEFSLNEIVEELKRKEKSDAAGKDR